MLEKQQQESLIPLLKSCPVCDRTYTSAYEQCLVDGSPLIIASTDRLVGSKIGNYEVLSLIGSGGWGRVYKAQNLTLGTTVAIKTLHSHLVADQENGLRFQQEAKACCKLRHEGIASVFDFGTLENGQPYFVMEYIEGTTLESLLTEKKPLPLSQTLEIFKQICRALESAHSQGILHRDIKPGNILLSSQADGKLLVKLLDFGLAKFTTEESDGSRLTQTGQTLGTPAYMSPEQCRGGQLDARADIYSLGCVMYEVLTGLQPFEADNQFESMYNSVHKKPGPFKTVAPNTELPSKLEDIVLKSLEKDPSRRQRTAAELLAELTLVQQRLDTRKRVSIPSFKSLLRGAAWSIRKNLRWLIPVAMAGAASIGYYAYNESKNNPLNLPPLERWQYYMIQGCDAEDRGNYTAASQSFLLAQNVSDTFADTLNSINTKSHRITLLHLRGKPFEEHQLMREAGNHLSYGTAPGEGTTPKLEKVQAQLMSDTLDRLVAAHPIKKEELAACIRNVIQALDGDNNVLGAPALTRKTADIARKYIADDKKICLNAMERLAWYDYLSGNHTEALELDRQMLDLAGNTIAKTDQAYIKLLHNLGAEYVRLNDPVSGKKCFEQELRLQQMTNTRTAGALDELAAIYWEQGYLNSAADHYREGMQLCISEDNLEYASYFATSYVNVMHAANRDNDLRAFFSKQKELAAKAETPLNMQVALYDYALAELSLLAQDYPTAQRNAWEAMLIWQSRQVCPTNVAARALETTRRALLAQHKYAEALPLAKTELAYEEQLANRTRMMEALIRLAYCCERTGQPQLAKIYLNRFEQLVDASARDGQVIDATLSVNSEFTALVGTALDRHVGAELIAMLEKAKDMNFRDGSYLANPSVGQSLALSRVYLAMNDSAQALSQAKEAVDRVPRAKLLQPYIFGNAYAHYADLLSKMGRNADAEAVREAGKKYPVDRI